MNFQNVIMSFEQEVAREKWISNNNWTYHANQGPHPAY